MRVDFIKGALIYTQDPLDVRIEDKTCIPALRLRLEGKLMNKVAKIVIYVLEVGHNLINLGAIEHEGPSRGELDVPRNFVHFDRTGNVAPLVGPLMQLPLPLFLYALLCGGLAVSRSTE